MAAFYRHSGKVPRAGLYKTLLCSLAAAAPLAGLYACATVHVSTIYLNGLFSAGFGLLLGCLVARLAERHSLRSTWVSTAIAGLTGLWALYLAWGFDLLHRDAILLPPARSLSAFHPLVLKNYLSAFYQAGLWGLPFIKAPVAGPLLGAIWLGEGILIVGGALFVTARHISRAVYCERCGCWTTHIEEAALLSVARSRELVDVLQSGEPLVQSLLHPAPTPRRAYLRVSLDCCKKCTETLFVDIERVSNFTEATGKHKTHIESVVRRLKIKLAQAEQLLAVGHPDRGADGLACAPSSTAERTPGEIIDRTVAPPESAQVESTTLK
jgi:hypothetical protein